VAEGTLYFVGANLEYTMDGERYEIPVAPDDIFVRPMPELALDYFLPRNVHANDPFTDEIEPPEPFTLRVRVQNFGDGYTPIISGTKNNGPSLPPLSA